MRSRTHQLWAAAAVLAGLGMAAGAARADSVPFFMSPGMTTHRLFMTWFNNNAAFFDLEGFSSAADAAANGTAFVPRLNQATLAGDMWLFIVVNGPPGQQMLVESVPDDPSGRYSPVMRIILLQWP